jgi:ribonuclease D
MTESTVAERRIISRAELMALPILHYTGAIFLAETEGDLDHALTVIRRERVVGLDTETKPTFRKGQSHLPSLVQIATQGTVFLFQIQRLDCSSVVAPVLSAHQTIKAGIGLDRDLIELKKIFPFEAANIFDLGRVAESNNIGQTGVRNLAGMFLGGRITKGAQTSNWAQPKLSASQLRYAATDAWVCRELYLRFEELGLRAKAPAPGESPQPKHPARATRPL